MVYEYLETYDELLDEPIFTESMYLFLENDDQNKGNDGILGGLGRIINQIITGFMNFFKNLFGVKNKEKLDAVGDALQKNPNLANKQVKYYDCAAENAENAKHLEELGKCKSDDDLNRENTRHNKQMSGLKDKAVKAVALGGLYKIVNGISVNIQKGHMESDLTDPSTQKAINEAKRLCDADVNALKRNMDDAVNTAMNDNADKTRQKIRAEAERTLKDVVKRAKRTESERMDALLNGANVTYASDAAAQSLNDNALTKAENKNVRGDYMKQSRELQTRITNNKKKLNKILSSKGGETAHWDEVKQLRKTIADDTQMLMDIGNNAAKTIRVNRQKNDEQMVNTVQDINSGKYAR